MILTKSDTLEAILKFFFLAVFTLFFSNSLASADPVILRLGTAAPEKTPWGTAISRFVEDVSNLSDGAIEVQPAFNSELGDEPTMARQLPRGRLDIAFLSNAASSLLVPEFGLLMAPYLFDNMNQADCVFDHHIVDTFNTPFKAAGVEMLTSVEIGRMVFMATKPLHRPADLRGQKIRTAPTLTDTTYIQAMGATPVPLGNVESMVAIRTGLVVAVTTPIVMGVAAGFAAEGPEITVTQHGHQVGALLISRKSWDRLDANGQTALREAAQVMTELRPAVRAAETQLLAGAALEGATVHELTDEEMAEWESYAIEATELVVDDLGPAGARTWHRLNAAKAICAE